MFTAVESFLTFISRIPANLFFILPNACSTTILCDEKIQLNSACTSFGLLNGLIRNGNKG